MARHNQLGKSGEEYAADYLVSRGYVIRDVNWRSGKFELDVVAFHDNLLVIAEVKTRSSEEYEYPEDAVTNNKIRRIVRAAESYVRMFDLPFEVRFDVISVLGKEPPFEIKHIEDAFIAPLNI